MIGFLLTVGPREGDIATDLLQSIIRSYPDAKTWVRDDATEDGTFDMLKQMACKHPSQIDLVRNPSPMGFLGLPVSIFRSFTRICEASEHLEMLIKLDPDVWLRGGLVRFAREKFEHEGPGIIGSFMRHPAQGRRKHWKPGLRILMDLLPIGYDRSTQKLRAGLPFYASRLPAAVRNGYRPGLHVLGGLYIVNGDTLYALHAKGYWASLPDAGSRNVKEEDALVSIGPYFIGHKLIEMHNEGKSQVWIQHRGPLPLTADQIIRGGYLAVHPLKRDGAAMEIRQGLARLAQQAL